MKRPTALLICLLLIASGLSAQDIHTELMTPTWKKLALKHDKQVGKLKWVAVFPDELKALANKPVELPGYIYPTKATATFSEFLLSVVPIAQCPYCGTGDIPEMVVVRMKRPIAFDAEPVRLKGRLLINTSENGQPAFTLIEAELK
ncbi:hypothetical protein C7T94_12290 [Pedobacter yulinensis]|uniref:DUF3299 domain-containing protein n=1 Tax=Pedobacter yulinensis TaxID=2126353 RepID=A0A2T3HLU1_9SPHI|nr:hypothetical protein [Pedobacter yulinensis]PST83351.1 hypothetical protein C7T94_12290 [Pedobacter yulinensis]